MSSFQKFQSTFFLIMVSLTLMLTYVTNAQLMAPSSSPSPTPSVSTECFNALLNVTDCLSYVETGSNLTKPDKPCCPELAWLVDSYPVCLCDLLAGAAESYGFSVDNKRALALPKVCHVSTPPVSTCAFLGVPVSVSPAEAPGSGMPESVGPTPAETPGPVEPGSAAGSPASEAKDSTQSRATCIDSVNSIVLIASSFILTTIAISGIF